MYQLSIQYFFIGLMCVVNLASLAAVPDSPLLSKACGGYAAFLRAQSTPAIPFEDLPMMTDLPLSPNLILALKDSPLAKKYSKIKFFFYLPYYYHGKILSFPKHWFGEVIQSDFVAKTLRVLFPEAQIPTDLERSVGPGKNQIPINLSILDMGERSHRLSVTKENILDMRTVKVANGIGETLQREDLRDKLGIPRTDFVISIYGKKLFENKNTSQYPNLSTIIKALDQAAPAKVIFLTDGGASRVWDAQVPADLKSQFRIIFLSKLKPKDFLSSERLLVLNDLEGRMPYVNALANAAVVRGPINFLEPLTVHTPVLFFKNDEVLGDYEVAGFHKLSEIAEKSGGAFPLSNERELTKKAKTILERPNLEIIPPYQVKIDEHSSLDHYLEELELSLKRAMSEFQEKDKSLPLSDN